MTAFWIVAGALSAAAAALMLLRAARAGAGTDPTQDLYRRQLRELDDLAARGLLPEPERAAARAEAARRLLGAAEASPEAWTTRPAERPALALAAGGALAAALVLYVVTGAPGLADQPMTTRLAEWREADPASLEPAKLAALLRQVTQERPGDPEAWRFLALAEGASGDPMAAVRALRRAVIAAPERADLWEMLGEAVVIAAEGEVTEGARQAFREALARDPSLVAPRFHLARARIAAGEVEAGLADWRDLMAELPAADPRRAALAQAIAQAQDEARNEAQAGPDAQMAAIRGMVDGLAARLEAQPDDPEGWVRLVRSYAVLGETQRRDAALARARARFAADPAILQALDAAARTEPMR